MHLTLAHAVTVALLGAAQQPAPPAPPAIPELLSIPAVTVLRCRLTQPTSGARLVTVQLAVGRAPDPVTRSIRITFDSSGHPADLLDAITVLDRAHGISMRSASARMSATATTGLTVTHLRSWSTPAERLTPAPKGSVHGTYLALNEDQKERARGLAVWVWAHRCPAAGPGRSGDHTQPQNLDRRRATPPRRKPATVTDRGMLRPAA